MKDKIKEEVLQRMLRHLDNAQSKELEQTLEIVLCIHAKNLWNQGY
ncbi:MAG: hypothetical protein ACI4CS_09825 [Candidatus Weimeria sp.]